MSVLDVVKKLRHKRLESKISKLESELGLNTPLKYDIIFDEWYPYCSITHDGSVLIVASRGFAGITPWYYVSPPNVIESFFGITFEEKINKTFLKVQNRCNKMNQAEAYAKRSLLRD